MTSQLANRAGMATATTGTGTVTLGAALAGTGINQSAFQTFASAGVVDQQQVAYLILDTGGAWEYGTGTYTAAGTTLSRTLGQSSTGSLLSLSGNAQVFIANRQQDTARPADVQNFNTTGAGQTWTKPIGFGATAVVHIQAWGGGGGGGRAATPANAGGGGGGAYIDAWVPLSTLAATETVGVGTGGNGATVATGTVGGSSTFTINGVTFTAFGGGGGGGGSSGLGGQGAFPFSAGAGSTGTIWSNLDSIGTNTTQNAQTVIHGAAGASNTLVAGNAIGGGGGGGCSSHTAGGTSIMGGSGQTSGAGTPAQAAQPGGGGAASTSGNTTGGQGGNGQVIYTTFDGL